MQHEKTKPTRSAAAKEEGANAQSAQHADAQGGAKNNDDVTVTDHGSGMNDPAQDAPGTPPPA
jgi:hypothetical protein